MDPTTTPAGTGAPIAAPPPIVPAATPAPPPAPQAADDQNPAWLAGRLERERRVLLESLGITDPAKAKEALAAAKKAEDDAKSAAEKLGETSAKLTAAEQALAKERAATAEYAKSLLAPLTPEQKTQVTSAIRAAAGNPEDPALQISMVSALRGGWAAPAVTPATPAPAAAPLAAPATTMQPPTAPAGTPGTSPPDYKAEYARLKATNPGAAVVYLQRYEHQIYPRA